jgi:hypothetical protein
MFVLKKTTWIFSVCLLCLACLDQPDCFNLTNNTVAIGFKKVADGSADTLAILEIQVVGADSAFIEIDTTITTGLQLPLDYLTDQTFLSIKDIERTQSFTVGYSTQSQFVAEECEPRFILSNLKILAADTDSLSITSRNPGSGTNVNLYRCPRTNIVKLAFMQLVTGAAKKKDSIEIIDTNITNPITLLYPVTGKNITVLKLPLDTTANSTQFFFDLLSTTRTITFAYDRVQATRYAVCGSQTFITNLRVTASDFADVNLVQDLVSRRDSIYDPPRTNFEIFQ